MGFLTTVASRADVPVFPVVGVGGRIPADALWSLPGVRVVDTPRAAVVLVVVGRLTRALLHPTMLVHDQLPGPRATVWWPVGGDGQRGGLSDGDSPGVDETASLLAALPEVVTSVPGDADGLRTVFVDVLTGRRSSGAPALTDIESPRWRGVGPYGHGGEGMMGGVPYGRAFAEMADDPDGLMLDRLPLHVGPHFPAFPPGLVLHLSLAGDVIRGVVVGDNPYRSWPGDLPVGPLDTAPFVDALTGPTTVAALEVERARHHLRWLARTLRLHGLAARGQRISALAQSLSIADRAAVEALARRLGRDRGLAAATGGVGVVDLTRLKRQAVDPTDDGRAGQSDPRLDVPAGPAARTVAGLPAWQGDVPGGPVARAAGLAVDARTHDPAYADLGFEPVVHHEGDARARLRQRATEAAQALALAARAGDLVRSPGWPVEGPRGALTPGGTMPSTALVDLLPGLLDGMEWGDAVTTVASLDLDLEEAAFDQSVTAWPVPTGSAPDPAAAP